MEKRPSPWTIVLTGWLGFMFAVVGAAVLPRLQLAVAPILCHGAYGHGVVDVHNYTYGTTSGYTTSLRCANAQHQEHGTSLFAVIGLLWLYGWVAALAIRGAYYWGRFAVTRGVDAYWRRRLPPPPVRRRRRSRSWTRLHLRRRRALRGVALRSFHGAPIPSTSSRGSRICGIVES